MSGGMPSFTSGVAADSFQVRERSAQSPEADQMFKAATAVQGFADQMGQRAEREATQYSAEQGAQTQIYEQMPDGTQRLRPVEELLTVNFGTANRAYNQAVLRNYAGAVETDAREAFGRFQTTYANDPGAFGAAARSYIDETTRNMPREARGVIYTQLNGTAAAFQGGIAERQSRIAREQLFQAHSLTVNNLVRDIGNLSGSNADDPRLPAMVQNFDQQLRALQVQHPDQVNDVTRDTAMRNVYRMIETNRVVNGVIGAYRTGGQDPDGAAQTYLNQYRARLSGTVPFPQQAYGPGGPVPEPGTAPQRAPPPAAHPEWIPAATEEDRRQAREIAGSGALTAGPNAARHPQSGRPILRNPDGSISTERSITIQDDRLNNGRFTNIPSIQEGQQLSSRQAIAYAVASRQQFASYATLAEAEQAATQRSHSLAPSGTTPPAIDSATPPTPGVRGAPAAGPAPLPGGQPGVDRPYTEADMRAIYPSVPADELRSMVQSANEANPVQPQAGGADAAPSAAAPAAAAAARQPAPPIGSPPQGRFTPDEVQQMYQQGQAAAADLRNQRLQNRQNYEQVRADTTRRALEDFHIRNGDVNPRNDPVIAAGVARDVAAQQTNPDAARAVQIAWQYPETARGYEVQSAEQTHRAQTMTADQQRETNAIYQEGRIAISHIDPQQTEQRRAAVEAFAMRAPTPDMQNQIRANLGSDVEAAGWGNRLQKTEAYNLMNAQKMEQRNSADAAAGRPPTYPSYLAAQTLPPHMLPAISAGIIRDQQAAASREATYNAANHAVINGLIPGNTAPETAQLDTVLTRGHQNPNGTSSPIDWDSSADVRRAAAIMTNARVIATEATRRIANGVAVGAPLSTAEYADNLWSQITANPATRDRMNQLLGADTVQQLTENATQIRAIHNDHANEVNGEYSPALGQRAWDGIQRTRAEVAATPQPERDRRMTLTFGNNAAGEVFSRAVTALNTADTQFTSMRAALAAQLNPVASLFASRFHPGSEMPTGVPNVPDFIVGLMSGGVASLFSADPASVNGYVTAPVATGPNDIPTGAVALINQGAERAVTRGETNKDTAVQAGIDNMRAHSWGASYLQSQYQGQARYVEQPIEQVGLTMHNLQPHEVTEQVLQGYAHVVERLRQAGIGVRQFDPMTALANKDFFVEFVRGTESNPQYRYMIRQPDQPGRIGSGAYVPVESIQEASGATVTPYLSLHPTPQSGVERAQREAHEAQSRAWVQQHFPGVSTLTQNAMIRYGTTQLGLGVALPGADEVAAMRRAQDALRGLVPTPPATGEGTQVLPPSPGSVAVRRPRP